MLNVEAEGNKGLGVDVVPGQDTVRTPSGSKLQRVAYDLIVGADGELIQEPAFLLRFC
jgi:hypothetical protein